MVVTGLLSLLIAGYFGEDVSTIFCVSLKFFAKFGDEFVRFNAFLFISDSMLGVVRFVKQEAESSRSCW